MKYINDLVRFFLTFLSFPYNLKREKLSKNQELIIQRIQDNLKNLIRESDDKLLTHQHFSNSVTSLIREGKLKNFLRKGFIQKMFFVHNRFYNLKFLKKIINSKQENWIQLLRENEIGNPVPFFMNKKTSGNRIRHVYLAKEIYDFGNIKKLDAVIEIGGGYGCMASIFNKIDKNINYTIFDLPEVNLLAYYYLGSQNIDCGLNSVNKKINLISDIKLIQKKFEMYQNENQSILFIANWSLSEMPIKLRLKLEYLIKNCTYGIISFQSTFEEISNINYFNKLKKEIGNTYVSDIKNLEQMNSNLNSIDHFTFLFKKNI